MHCQNCEHWQKKTHGAGGVVENQGGHCLNPLLAEDYGSDSYNHNGLVYSYNEGGCFWTGAKFGCVNFKEKA